MKIIFSVVYVAGLIISTIDQILMERSNRINTGIVCIPNWKLFLLIVFWPITLLYHFIMSLTSDSGYRVEPLLKSWKRYLSRKQEAV